MQTGRPEIISNINKNAILKLLRKNESLSRAQIARRLNITFPTVSSNVKKLLEKGLIKEIGKGNNDLGRKSTLLKFNASKGFIIGIDVGRSHISAVISDLKGEIFASVKNNCSEEKNGQFVLKKIIETIEELYSSFSPDNIISICIGIPGIRDNEKGKNKLAPFIDSWENIDVEGEIKSKFATKVILDNSVNFGAIGEKWQGNAQGYKNIIYINYGVGIGAGIILNGELYKGKNNAAGEIGYLSLDKFHLRRNFQEEGALEEVISGYAISKKMNMLSDKDKSYTVKEVFALARTGNQLAREIIEESINYFAMVLINITSILNPEIIVVSGGIGKVVIQRYRNKLLSLLKSHAPYVPELVSSKLEKKANVLGAIGVGIRYAKNEILW